MKTQITLLFLFLLSVVISAQDPVIDRLEIRLKKGDKTALIELGAYFDNQKNTKEIMNPPYQKYKRKITYAELSRKLVGYNSIFFKDEIEINKVTKEEFLQFIRSNYEQITFSPLANSFILKPFEERKIAYQIRAITNYRKRKLLKHKARILQIDLLKKDGLGQLLEEKNPRILLEIVSFILKEGKGSKGIRYRRVKSFIDLIELLTQTSIAVPDKTGELNYRIKNTLQLEWKTNLLIFFQQNYQNYKWDSTSNIFINPQFEIIEPSLEQANLEQLSDINNEIAFQAFEELTMVSPEVLPPLLDEYEDYASFGYNMDLPNFFSSSLMVLSKLTKYCRANNIDFRRTKTVLPIIKKLGEDLSSIERYHFENEVIQQLTLDDITAVEYWAIFYQEAFSFSSFDNSIGRILDKLYSKEWGKLINDEKHLKCFLKKYALFKRLIGLNYLSKFIAAPAFVKKAIDNIKTDDPDIKREIERIKTLDSRLVEMEEYCENVWKEDNKDTLQDNSNNLLIDQEDSARSKKVKERLLLVYKKLDQANIDYKKTDHSLDYDKIYQILKYDINDGFLGMDNWNLVEDYICWIIHLLEINFNTTLDYPHEFYKNNDLSIIPYEFYKNNDLSIIPHGKCVGRKWMEFLKEKHLIQLNSNEPMSFNYIYIEYLDDEVWFEMK